MTSRAARSREENAPTVNTKPKGSGQAMGASSAMAPHKFSRPTTHPSLLLDGRG